jgi:Lrp/AsnC family transcriptional regulator, leucine-responsive regulatory protein
MIDDIDRKILKIIQNNARASHSEIAKEVGLATSAVFERIRKLEKRNIIQGYETRLNSQALNLGLVAFIAVRAQERIGSLEIGKRLAHLPQVLEIHDVAGEDCYLLKVRVANTEALGAFLREQLGPIEAISSTRTTIALATVKETAQLPLENETQLDSL